ncbi:MAG: M23 family metallopeptidase [Mariprofundus sp.]
MNRYARLFFIALLWALAAPAAQAMSYTASQGDVVTVEFAMKDGATPTLSCFGINWPVKELDQHRWRGWIGVDMHKKQGNYKIHWRYGRNHTANDTLTVDLGNFRISHISVKKSMAEFDKPTLQRIRREVKALKATYSQPVAAKLDIVMHFFPVDGIVSTPFGARRYVNGQARSAHSGIDIAAPAGTPIRLPLAGSVLMVADMYLNGKTVAIGHGNGLVSVYSHMQATHVTPGQWVKTGDVIGDIGATGRATGPHLHWGVRFNNARVNPASMLAKTR